MIDLTIWKTFKFQAGDKVRHKSQRYLVFTVADLMIKCPDIRVYAIEAIRDDGEFLQFDTEEALLEPA